MSPDQLSRLSALVAQGYSDAEVAARMGVTSRTVLRWRKAHGIASQWAPTIPEHGTEARYRRPHRCRCAECRAANTAAQTAYRDHAQAITLPTATRNREPWTPAEDAAVLATSGSLISTALRLRRSYLATVMRHHQLQRKARP